MKQSSLGTIAPQRFRASEERHVYVMYLHSKQGPRGSLFLGFFVVGMLLYRGVDSRTQQPLCPRTHTVVVYQRL